MQLRFVPIWLFLVLICCGPGFVLSAPAAWAVPGISAPNRPLPSGDRETIVRVGLRVKVKQAWIGGGGGLVLSGADGGSIRPGTVSEYLVEASADTLKINHSSAGCRALLFSAANPRRPLLLDGRPYRGNLLVLLRPGGLTVVNQVELEDYLCGVLGSEMPRSWPLEALKAQAVAARTYAIYKLEKHSSPDFELLPTVADQVYGGVYSEDSRTSRAVYETRGRILAWEGQPIKAYYHSCCGGHTEDGDRVFAENRPVLRGVEDPYCASATSGWRLTLSGTHLGTAMSTLKAAIGIPLAISAEEVGPSGRPLRFRIDHTRGITYISAPAFRKLLGYSNLRSLRLSIRKGGLESRNMTCWLPPPGWRAPPAIPIGGLNPVNGEGRRAIYPPPWYIYGPIPPVCGAFLESTISSAATAGDESASPIRLDSPQFTLWPGRRTTLQSTLNRRRQILDLLSSRLSLAIPKADLVANQAVLSYNFINRGQLVKKITAVPQRWEFSGRGWGHGVGMCQWGARGMAREGFDYGEILAFYYRDIELMKFPPGSR